MSRLALVPLALAIGCNPPPSHAHPDAPAPAPDACADAAPTPDAPACPMTAPPGTVLWQTELGPADLVTKALTNLAIDGAGDILHAHPVLTKLSPGGALLLAGGPAEVVATDATRHIYIAFVRDNEVFLDKLTAAGTLVFEVPLPPCDPSVRSIAVAGDGRIAVSGPGLGTVVLDAGGALVFQHSYDGFVAFDAAGDLLVTGAFSGPVDFGDGPVTAVGPTDAFIVALDRSCGLLWKQIISDPPGEAGGQRGTGIAVGPDGSLAAIGEFDDSADVFGMVYVSGMSPTLNLDGGYVVKLDAGGHPLWSVGYQAQQVMGGVAFDHAGDVLVSGAEASNVQPPLRRSLLISLSPSGSERWRRSGPGFELGAGLGVAADACSIAWAAEVRDVPLPGPTGSWVLKIAP